MKTWHCLIALVMVQLGCGLRVSAFNPEEIRKQILTRDIEYLCGQDAKEREGSKRFLVQPQYYRTLRAETARLLPCLQDYATSKESALVLGLLDVPAYMVNQLLTSPHTPDQVKARLGDQRAEQRVIEKFNDLVLNGGAVWNGPAFQESILELLYVATPAAICTFAKGLESKKIYEYYAESKTSLVAILVGTYAKVYRDVPLFDPKNLEQHAYTTREEFQKPHHQKFLREVEGYFKRTYGIEIHITAPFLIEGERPVPQS